MVRNPNLSNLSIVNKSILFENIDIRFTERSNSSQPKHSIHLILILELCPILNFSTIFMFVHSKKILV